MHKRLFPYFEAIIVVLWWSTAPPLVKLLLNDLSPSEITGIRYFGAFIMFIPLLLIFSRQVLRALTARDWLLLGIMGIPSFTIADLVISKGLENIDPTTSAFLLNVIPVLTFLLGAVFLKETPSSQQWLGLFIAIAGAVVFFGNNIELDNLYGIALTLIGVIAYTTSGLIGRSMARKRVVDSITL